MPDTREFLVLVEKTLNFRVNGPRQAGLRDWRTQAEGILSGAPQRAANVFDDRVGHLVESVFEEEWAFFHQFLKLAVKDGRGRAFVQRLRG